MEPTLGQKRRAACERNKCSHIATNRFDDICSACPAGHWRATKLFGCGEPALPSKLTMAKNAMAAGAQVLRRGREPVSVEEQASRKAICLACEFYRKSDDRCSKCGCHLDYKSRLKAWHCPIDKW
jgi:hypothetical protein